MIGSFGLGVSVRLRAERVQTQGGLARPSQGPEFEEPLIPLRYFFIFNLAATSLKVKISPDSPIIGLKRNIDLTPSPSYNPTQL
jgi:hypothetical protein